ncbi:MAG: hypothetical protein J6T10_15095 [Methanobrevibacter sp.]|nr:hypothetical protein [Methanobrevibacter sp.]
MKPARSAALINYEYLKNEKNKLTRKDNIFISCSETGIQQYPAQYAMRLTTFLNIDVSHIKPKFYKTKVLNSFTSTFPTEIGKKPYYVIELYFDSFHAAMFLTKRKQVVEMMNDFLQVYKKKVASHIMEPQKYSAFIDKWHKASMLSYKLENMKQDFQHENER